MKMHNVPSQGLPFSALKARPADVLSVLPSARQATKHAGACLSCTAHVSELQITLARILIRSQDISLPQHVSHSSVQALGVFT